MAPPTCQTGRGQHQSPHSACRCSRAPRAQTSRARRVNKMALGGEPEEPDVAKAVTPSMPRRERKAAASSAQSLKWGGAITQGPLSRSQGRGVPEADMAAAGYRRAFLRRVCQRSSMRGFK